RGRKLFAETATAKARGGGIGRFSFDVTEGRCPECAGLGQIEAELIFLPGAYATCPRCHRPRLSVETGEVQGNGRAGDEGVALAVTEAQQVFADDDAVLRTLEALTAIGLGYITLGQRATELSGGEAQRDKLATELQRITNNHTLYILDEPS